MNVIWHDERETREPFADLLSEIDRIEDGNGDGLVFEWPNLPGVARCDSVMYTIDAERHEIFRSDNILGHAGRWHMVESTSCWEMVG